MNDLDDLEIDGHPNRYAMGAVIVFALAALPNTRFQPLFKMAVWTTILIAGVFSAVRPMRIDVVVRIVVGALCLLHFGLMVVSFPLIAEDGYIGIGLALVIEIVLFSIPMGWLVLRSRRAELDRNR
jgi:hypothetical protein